MTFETIASLPIDVALRQFLDEQPALGAATSPQQARERLAAPLATRNFPGLPNEVATEDLQLPGTIAARLYRPPFSAAQSLPVLVHLHGGGWVAGSIATHDPFCRLLCAQAQVILVSVGYRLAPEHPHPAALEDGEAALRWVAANATGFGGDAARLGLSGDSAGGHLAAVLANRLAAAGGDIRLKALALLYPVTDYPQPEPLSYMQNATGYGLEAAGMRWYWNLYAPEARPDDPEISPLRARLPEGLPPTLVATAQYDVLRDEGIAYARKLRMHGVPVTHLHAPDMHHNFPVGPSTVGRFPQSQQALTHIAAWLRAQLSSAGLPGRAAFADGGGTQAAIEM